MANAQHMEGVFQSCFSRSAHLARSLGAGDDCEDVAQVAIVRYWRRVQNAAPADLPADPYPQIAGLVRDVMNERWGQQTRRRSRVARVGAAVSQFTAEHVSSPLISAVRRWMAPGTQLEREQLSPLLLEALDALPSTQYAVLWMGIVHEASYEQIEIALQITPGAARQRMARAIKGMETYLVKAGVKLETLRTVGSRLKVPSAPAPRASIRNPGGEA